MKHNVGTADRLLRLVVAVAMLVSAVVAPVSLAVRVGLLGGMGAYMLITALAGTCLGYRMMGRSTCPL